MRRRFSKIILVLLSLNLTTPLFAATDTLAATPPAHATDKELADYYSQLAEHYQRLSHQYQVKAELNKNTQQAVNLPVPPKTQHHSKMQKAFAGSYAGLGDVFNTGNVSSNNFYAKGYLQYQPSKNALTTGEVTYQNAHQSGKGQLDNRLYTDLNSAYNFDGVQGIYGDINYTRDTFSGYDYVFNQSLGYNRILYKSAKYQLTGQLGPGLQEQRIQSTGEQQRNPLINLRLVSAYQITADNLWQETLTNVTTKLNNNTTLDSSLTTEIFKKFALQFDILVSNDTHPLPGKFGLNTTSTISIIYNF